MSSDFTLDPGVAEGLALGRYGRFLLSWSTLSAVCGVALLLGVCLMTAGSVVARAIWGTPLAGDVEITQMICALAIAACLPYAQMKNAHVIVDFFTQKASPKMRALLDAWAACIMAVMAAVLTWRSLLGVVDAYQLGEISMVLGWPLWWAQLTITPGFALLALTAVYTAWSHWRLFTSRSAWTA